MEKALHIRPAEDSDADQISKLVQEAIRISNAQDYPEAVLERVVASFTTEAVQALLRRRIVLVALNDGVIVGTAGLDGAVVRTVFVTPNKQGIGVGRGLMNALEAIAVEVGTPTLQVPASLTAKAFYSRLGYAEIREVLHGDERTVIMEKRII